MENCTACAAGKPGTAHGTGGHDARNGVCGVGYGGMRDLVARSVSTVVYVASTVDGAWTYLPVCANVVWYLASVAQR